MVREKDCSFSKINDFFSVYNFIKHVIKLIEVMYTCEIICGELIGTGAVPL